MRGIQRLQFGRQRPAVALARGRVGGDHIDSDAFGTELPGHCSRKIRGCRLCPGVNGEATRTPMRFAGREIDDRAAAPAFAQERHRQAGRLEHIAEISLDVQSDITDVNRSIIWRKKTNYQYYSHRPITSVYRGSHIHLIAAIPIQVSTEVFRAFAQGESHESGRSRYH